MKIPIQENTAFILRRGPDMVHIRLFNGFEAHFTYDNVLLIYHTATLPPASVIICDWHTSRNSVTNVFNIPRILTCEDQCVCCKILKTNLPSSHDAERYQSFKTFQSSHATLWAWNVGLVYWSLLDKIWHQFILSRDYNILLCTGHCKLWRFRQVWACILHWIPEEWPCNV